MTNKSQKKTHHIFTDNKDWYIKSYNFAKEQYGQLVKEDRNARMYEIFDYDSEDTESENCLFAHGNYPA